MVSSRAVADSTKARRSWARRLGRLLAGIAICYAGVIIVLLFLENWLLFHPIRASEEWLSPPNGRVQDAELQTADGTLIHAWWCPTEDWEPAQGAMLYCHGNAGNLSHRATAIARWQRELGESILIFDYPGYGRSQGKPSEAGCYAAGDAAYDWLTQTKKVPPERLLIYGGSLGGGVAVDLASRRPHRGLVLTKTFTSIPDAAQHLYPWLPARWLARNQFNNLEKIGRCTQPVFIAHGTTDGLVPFSHGQRLFAAASEPKYFLTMTDIGHDEAVSSDFSTLRTFLARASAKAQPQTKASLSQN